MSFGIVMMCGTKRLQEQLDYANLHGYDPVEDRFKYPPYLTVKAGKYYSGTGEKVLSTLEECMLITAGAMTFHKMVISDSVSETNSAKD